MNYLNIIEENFTKADYVAYLRGYILKSLLEDKPFDTTEFKHYADKLVRLLEEPVDEQSEKLQVYKPTVDPDEPQVQPKPKFKLGDRVIITYNDFTGTIVRLPMNGVDFPEGYVVQLDNKTLGFTSTHEEDGVSCDGAWFASEQNLELINEATLEENKWYHTNNFSKEELQQLLPKGTKVEVEEEILYSGIDTKPPTNTTQGVVEEIKTSFVGITLVKLEGNNYLKEWFKILQEDK